MTQISRPWGGTTIGDAGPYSAPNWWDVWQSMSNTNGAVVGAGNKGVLIGVSDALEVTYVGPNFLSVAAGAAMVDGLFYHNDAAISVTVTSATAGNVRDDRLVIRKYFGSANQTARLILLAGAENASPGPGTPPALTQDTNRLTYWDLPLARVSVTDGGVMTLTDEREYMPVPGMVLLESHTVIDAAGETITFDNIPQYFSDLMMTYSGKATAYNYAGVLVDLEFNDDVDINHYAYTYEWYTWEAVSLATHYTFGTLGSGAIGVGALPDGNSAAQYKGAGWAYIPNYAASTIHLVHGDSMYYEPSNPCSHVCRLGIYDKLAAWAGISKIHVHSSANGGSGNYNFTQGSMFKLYGITA